MQNKTRISTSPSLCSIHKKMPGNTIAHREEGSKGEQGYGDSVVGVAGGYVPDRTRYRNGHSFFIMNMVLAKSIPVLHRLCSTVANRADLKGCGMVQLIVKT